MTYADSRIPARVRLLLALLLAGVAGPVAASNAAADAEAQPLPEERHPGIVVVAPPLFPDVQPERDLDEEAIESYGVSTIDELLANLQAELGTGEDEPLILVNGERLNDLSEIGAFPVEVVRNLQALPKGAAVKVGGRSGQRVVSITLKREARNVTLSAAQKPATEGDWDSTAGEAIFTHIRGMTRANISLRARDESSLFESERGIIQPDAFLPYAQTGNVVGYPDTTAEIDPLLSAVAGEVVTVTPVPGSTNPTLADFAAHANDPATTDLGRFRTLRPDSNNYDLNGTVSTRLTPWLTTNATFRLSRSTSEGMRGLASGLFLLPETNPASPFSRDVALTFYGDPLRYRTKRTGGEGNLTFNGQFGRWTGNFNARHFYSSDESRSDQLASFGNVTISDGVNPFAIDVTDFLPLRSDLTTGKTRNTLLQSSFTGPALHLPAGDLIATVEGRLAWYKLRSESTFLLGSPTTSFSRSEQSIRGALDVPLTSRGGYLGKVGDASITAEYGRMHFSDAGSLDRYALGVTWEPIEPLRLRAAIEGTEAPPSSQTLANPIVVTPEVRVFDPLTGQTVDVTQITGGNPDLDAEKVTIKQLGALLKIVPKLNLQLSAEYTDTKRRNFVSSLPEASAAVMLAFPDRYLRDADGQLTTIDLRPVNFDSEHEKRLRWGFNIYTRLTNPPPPTGSAPRKAPTLLQVTANHSIIFDDEVVIRRGLPPVDLLGGGAIGISGGRLRHQVDGTAAITANGLGARVGLLYRGRSVLDARIGGVTDTVEFSPYTILNVRAFADMRRFFPTASWARRLRLSVDVLNVLNDRQKVRDSLGSTPLQYQAGYRDPLGRTIEFEIRKVF